MSDPAEAPLAPGLAARAVEALEGGVVVLDRDGRILVWNRWMMRASGIAAQDALARKFADVFPEIVGTRLSAAVGDATSTGVSSLLTHALNPRMLPLGYQDGRDLLHSVTVRSLTAAADEEALCLIQVSDVTANVQREQLLRERRDARHRAVVDTAADAIITVDAEGKISWMNPAGERQFGYSAAELEGEDIGRLLVTGAPQWAEAASTAMPAAVVMSAIGRRKDGLLIDFDVSLSRWHSGGRRYATGILRDVTERKREQASLRQHDRRALLLAQAAAQLLAASDLGTAVRDLFDLIAGHLQLDIYFHHVASPGGSDLDLFAHGGIGAAEARIPAGMEREVSGEVARSRRLVSLAGIRASDDTRCALLRRIGVDAYVCGPLLAGERLIGTLGFGRSREGRPFDQDELRFLHTICNHVAMVQARLNSQGALRASEERFRLAVEGTGMAAWDLDLASGLAVWSRHHFLLLGYEPHPDGAATLAMWEDRLHPDDRAAVAAEWARAERERDVYHVSCRIRRADDGVERWIEAYGRFMHEPGAGRFIGVFVDVTDRRRAEEHQQLLMREVNHRAKNALAVVCSVLRLTRADDPKRFAEAVEGRVTALARAHTLLAEDLWTGSSLRAVVEQELAAYRGGGRVVLGGPPVRLTADAVQPLSMALHELATNAAKYGALSAPGGRVEVFWRAEPTTGRLRLCWSELDGPPVLALPERRGFGSTLLESVTRGQLGGKAEFHWHTEGLVCEMTIAAGKIGREPAVETGLHEPTCLPSNEIPAGSHGVSLRDRRVLVAEDETIVALELRELLTRLGCQVVGPAGSLAEALELAALDAEQPIDLCVLDVNLQGEISYPVADLLGKRGVPVIYTTGYGELPEGGARRASAVLLRKPVKDSELEAALREALGSTRPVGDERRARKAAVS